MKNGVTQLCGLAVFFSSVLVFCAGLGRVVAVKNGITQLVFFA